ncbi:MAG: hypothetical protein RLZZ26_522 [Candidatus Parcubacteria bacterium]|jgi:L-ascorbate metabolism protein UlaG (beta-lactamase superfamily)
MILLLGVLLVCIATALFVRFAPQFGRRPHGGHLRLMTKSPQYHKDHFDNSPVADPALHFTTMFGVLWEMLRGGAERRPRQKLPSTQPTFGSTTGAYLTWFGHSTFLYEVTGKKILFDPMLGKHASPVPHFVSRYPYDLPATMESLPHLDAVIISHDHYDHLDYKTVRVIKDKVDRFIMPLGVGSHLTRWGVPKEKITELDWWDTTTLGDTLIAATPSQHFSGRALSDRKKTLWAGWVIKHESANVFFGGDSGYFSGFADIGQKYGPFDLTLLDSGQYNERWKEVHMLPEQSVVAHRELRGKVFMPMHWSAFTLSIHAWNEPPERALLAAQKEQVEMITPRIGQRFNIITDRPQETWWRNVVS